MSENQELTPEIEIFNFKEKMLKKYNQRLYIYSPKSSDRITVDDFILAGWTSLIEEHPEFKDLEGFTHKTRQREFILYLHSMCWLAKREGYSYNSIGKAINRTHATILMGVRQTDNSLFTKDPAVIKAITDITNKIDNYVGAIPKNTEEQDNTKSSTDTFWDAAERFSSPDNWGR